MNFSIPRSSLWIGRDQERMCPCMYTVCGPGRDPMSSHYEQSGCPSSASTSVSESGRVPGRALQPVWTQRRGHFLLLHVCTPLLHSWTNICVMFSSFLAVLHQAWREGLPWPWRWTLSFASDNQLKSLTPKHVGSLTHTMTHWKSPEKLSFFWWWWLHSAEILNEPCEVVFSYHSFVPDGQQSNHHLSLPSKKEIMQRSPLSLPPPPLFPGISDVISL